MAAPAAESMDEDALYRKVIRRIVPLFFLGFVCSYLDRVNISLAKLPMQHDFGLTEHAFTLGASIFFWGYMVFEVPSNLLLQRVGARVWIARIMITWGLVSMLMVFSRSLPVFYGLRLLLGLCEAGFVPGVLYYANQWLPARRQSGMFALFLLALPVAEVIGAPVSGFIVEHTTGVGGLHGWQWLFLLEGAPTVVLGVVLFAVLRNRPDQVRWLTPAEQAVVVRNVSDTTQRSHRVLDAFLLPGVYLLIAIMLLFNTSFYGLVFWLPSIVEQSGVKSTTAIGLLTAIPFAVGGVSMLLVSRYAERSGCVRLRVPWRHASA
ncbi:MFS transporter [Terriglobus sp.]|uniref:MFS transporter n=1 Tax=Terriglobus sp. TaxID=1889013 RepID=UPI003AFF9A48